MDLLDTVSRSKRVTRGVLVVLLVVFAVMGVHGLYYDKDSLFLYIGIVHLFFAIDYLKSYGAAYETVTFNEDSMLLGKKRSSITVDYEEIESLTECRNGFLEISIRGGKPVTVHNDIPKGGRHDDPRRTANILRKEIESRVQGDVRVSFRDR